MRAAILVALAACAGSAPAPQPAAVENTASIPSSPRAATGPCTSARDCTLNGPGCNLASDADTRQASFLENPGPYCVCSRSGCLRQVADAVSCRSDNECAIENRDDIEIPVRAVPMRTTPLKPCEDAEHIPHCEAGVCVIEIYGC
jgi:hypothetical protein